MSSKRSIPVSSAFPLRFEPRPPQIKLYQRVFGWFSTIGRARLRLKKVCEAPAPIPDYKGLVRSFDKLLARSGSKNPKWHQAMRDVPLYLAWAAIRTSTIDSARRWLKEIDQISLDLPECLGLRWELMQLLFAKQDYEAYYDEAKKFFADSLLKVDHHSGALRESISALYEQMSPKHCEEVLLCGHQELEHETLIQTALDLCRCPVSFNSEDDARTWSKRVNSEVLKFSSLMTADALIIAAQAAEWSNKWDEMEAKIIEARKAAPDHSPVQYWLARARLHRLIVPPLEGLDESLLANLPGGRRLLLQVQLHQQPTFDSVAQILPVLEGKHGACDTQESALLMGLIEQALTSESARRTENLRMCADLSSAVSKLAGVMPWVEINCALAEIQLDYQYLQALQRLEARGVYETPPARQLAQIVRLLVGQPSRPEDLPENACLAILNEALHRLIKKGYPQDGTALLAKLETVAHHLLIVQYPALKVAADLLRLALRGLVVGDDVSSELLQYKIPQNAPPWAPWLLARLAVLDGASAEIESSLNHLFQVTTPPGTAALDQAAASFIDIWWRHFGCPGQIAAPRAVEMAQAMLLREPAKAVSVPPGSILEGVLKIETQWLNVLADSRTNLAKGQATSALSALLSIANLLEENGPVVDRVWRPLARYWIGISSIHAGSADAVLLLEELTSGPMEVQARAQLAMLALQNHDNDTASRWLKNLTPDFPAALYAQALLQTRINQPIEAMCFLDELDNRFREVPSTYVMAGRLLRAAIAERSADPAAKNLLLAILQDRPADGVAKARLDRIILKRAYDEHNTNETSITDLQLGALPTDPRPAYAMFTWNQQYQLFYHVLSYSKASSSDLLAPLILEVDRQIANPIRRVWWRELLAARLLQIKDPSNALKVLDIPRSSAIPPAIERSRAILRIWSELSCRTDWEPRDEVVRRLEEQVVALQAFRPDDPTANEWRLLAQNATSLIKGETVAPERWKMLGDSPISRIPFLFDDDQRIRNEAASALLPTINSNHSPWSEKAQLLLKALMAWATDKDDSFVEHYTALEPILDALPVQGRDLWVSAALIRFSKGDWRGLKGTSLPDCIADMSDPLVYLIVELAEARAAVADLKKPSQEVARRITGIQNNLTALVERLDSQGTAAGP